MKCIVIETARSANGNDTEFTARFPLTPKGLALALIRAAEMMHIPAQFVGYADITIKALGDSGTEIAALDDPKMFNLIAQHRASYGIFEDCATLVAAWTKVAECAA